LDALSPSCREIDDGLDVPRVSGADEPVQRRHREPGGSAVTRRQCLRDPCAESAREHVAVGADLSALVERMARNDPQ
jgi:hypothetical protein